MSRLLIAMQYLSTGIIVLWILARVRAFAKQKRLHPSDLLLGGVVIIWLVKNLILQPFIVTSSSMEPTLLVREVFLVNRCSYWSEEPQRGDIVVFRSKALGNRDLVKRILAVPGDSLSFKEGRCYLNGRALDLEVSSNLEIEFSELPPGEYFVVGDNFKNSRDSRAFGTIKRDWISGRAWRSLWPPARQRLLHPSTGPPQGSARLQRTA